MAIFTGNNSANVIIGTRGDDQINALGGNDTVLGHQGADAIDGGSGNDLLDGGLGADVINGGAGDDTIISAEGNDFLDGGAGNDTFFVHGLAGDVVNVTDTSGVDTLNFSSGVTGATINLAGGASSFVDGREIRLNSGSVLTPLDFVLLQDLSGSFSDDVATLQALAPNLVAGLEAIQPNTFFGVASFVDKPVSPFGAGGDYVYQTDLALTGDSAAFISTINNLIVRNGADTPESQIEALMQVSLRSAEVGYRVGAFRVVLLTTDAEPHVAGDFASAGPNDGDAILDGGGLGEDYPTVAQLRSALLAGNVVPIFAVTSGVLADYQALVTELGFGTVVELSSDSSDIIAAIETGIGTVTNTEIENAVGTNFADTIDGNALNNELSGLDGDDDIDGFAGNDVLDGGLGADTLRGGLGNDTYIVGSAGDVVIELAGQGTDGVISYVSYTLGANVENLTLGGSGNFSGTGNSLNNTLNGNSGNNALNGGAGNDVMAGGAGNDTYTVGAFGDIVTELAGQGTDRVISYVGYTLGANVENLTLAGSGAINGVGNSLNNVIVGNSGANRINGWLGNDTLTGGAGNDSFVFRTALGATNIDRITDFSVANDTIDLENDIFTALTATGVLAAGAFTIGASAADGGDRVIYNSTTGALFYDADGAGGMAQQQFATLNTGLALTNADFLVI